MTRQHLKWRSVHTALKRDFRSDSKQLVPLAAAQLATSNPAQRDAATPPVPASSLPTSTTVCVHEPGDGSAVSHLCTREQIWSAPSPYLFGEGDSPNIFGQKSAKICMGEMNIQEKKKSKKGILATWGKSWPPADDSQMGKYRLSWSMSESTGPWAAFEGDHATGCKRFRHSAFLRRAMEEETFLFRDIGSKKVKWHVHGCPGKSGAGTAAHFKTHGNKLGSTHMVGSASCHRSFALSCRYLFKTLCCTPLDFNMKMFLLTLAFWKGLCFEKLKWRKMHNGFFLLRKTMLWKPLPTTKIMCPRHQKHFQASWCLQDFDFSNSDGNCSFIQFLSRVCVVGILHEHKSQRYHSRLWTKSWWRNSFSSNRLKVYQNSYCAPAACSSTAALSGRGYSSSGFQDSLWTCSTLLVTS